MNAQKVNKEKNYSAEEKFMRQVKSLIDESYKRGFADGAKQSKSQKISSLNNHQ